MPGESIRDSGREAGYLKLEGKFWSSNLSSCPVSYPDQASPWRRSFKQSRRIHDHYQLRLLSQKLFKGFRSITSDRNGMSAKERQSACDSKYSVWDSWESPGPNSLLIHHSFIHPLQESSSNSFNYPLQGIRLQAPSQCQLREHGTHGTVRRSIRASHFWYSSQSKALPQSSHEIRLSWMVNDRQGSTQESISGRQNTRNHGDTELLRLHGSSRS